MITKQEFYEKVNRGCYPKYILSQIKEGKPQKNCASIICTYSGNILLAKYENGKWCQACFTDGPYQCVYYRSIDEEVIFYIDGKAKDTSRKQNE